MNRIYWMICTFVKPLLCLFFPLKTLGREKVPEGPALICPNHAHALDPFMVCFSLGGRENIRMMAKKELLKMPVLGRILQAAGMYGVDRGNADLQAIKDTIRFLQDGSKVLVFPEGTRVKYPGEVEAKTGVSTFALRTGVPIVPVYCGGKKKIFQKTTVIFGEPYYPQIAGRRATAEENQQIADEIMRRAYALGDIQWK